MTPPDDPTFSQPAPETCTSPKASSSSSKAADASRIVIAPEKLPSPAPSQSPAKTLRQLFLTLFLRGRSSRGLQKKTAPKTVGQKLALTLLFYGVFGCLAFTLRGQPVFALSIYLHALTFVLLGMFVASAAGEILFNKEEADILLHRPISPRSLLWAKIGVLLEVSVWLAGALNLAGFLVGYTSSDGGFGFVATHALSVVLEALFCTGCVVMAYQLCIRWFGRERLEGLMTTAQVVISVAAVLSGQILPRAMMHLNNFGGFHEIPWWIVILPPAWFAGIDDALAGSGAPASWLLTGLAAIATTVVLWIAFGKLAHNYEAGLQTLNESVSRRRRKQTGRRWVDIFIDLPPLRWWLGDPVVRASFLLTTAYLARDRDMKLRIYPGIAPVLVVPFIFLLQGQHGNGFGNTGFSIAFAGAYVGIVPLMGVNILQYSQQWQASDVFRAAPIYGPAPLCHGARRAIVCLLTLPLVAVFGVVAFLLAANKSQLLLLLPGVIAMPVFALVSNLGGNGVPLSLPTDEAKSAGRSLMMIGVIPISMAISGLASWAFAIGWIWWFVLAETILVVVLQVFMINSIKAARWQAMD
jgi:ABC-2 type transport system permease protein